jgi:hypothetical protein
LEKQNSELKTKVVELEAALKTKKSNTATPRNENNNADVQ